jgi:hypothetical protein
LEGSPPADPPGHVFRTRIGATTWTDISPSATFDGPFGALALDGSDTPTTIYVGTDFGVLRSATYGRGVFEFPRPDWSVIAVDPEADLDFGTTCDADQYLTLHVFNVGGADLVISSVQRLTGSTGFQVLGNPATPLVLRRGEDISFTVRFAATTPGISESATIRIVSNDPAATVVDLLAPASAAPHRWRP